MTVMSFCNLTLSKNANKHIYQKAEQLNNRLNN